MINFNLLFFLILIFSLNAWANVEDCEGSYQLLHSKSDNRCDQFIEINYKLTKWGNEVLIRETQTNRNVEELGIKEMLTTDVLASEFNLISTEGEHSYGSFWTNGGTYYLKVSKAYIHQEVKTVCWFKELDISIKYYFTGFFREIEPDMKCSYKKIY